MPDENVQLPIPDAAEISAPFVGALAGVLSACITEMAWAGERISNGALQTQQTRAHLAKMHEAFQGAEAMMHALNVWAQNVLPGAKFPLSALHQEFQKRTAAAAGNPLILPSQDKTMN